MSDFDSLTLALAAWFDKALCDLPDQLRQRVEREFLHLPWETVPVWDSLSVDQRRGLALQMDFQRDPTTEQDRQFWWDFAARQHDLEKQIEQWEAVSTPTAGDMALKEARLAELQQELARMEQQQRQTRGDYYPGRNPLDGDGESSSTTREAHIRYIAYPKALNLLAERLAATPEELAGWVFTGPKDGGLSAYLNANEIDPPPRFHYSIWGGDNFDYLSPLMACWFREDEIAQFNPTDRFITGKALIERWSVHPGVQSEAFIRAKIAESRLLDAHPITGGTQETFPHDASYPPLTSGLFVLAHVEAIEAEDFAENSEPHEPAVSLCQPVSSWQIRHHFSVTKDADANEKWWKEKMADAERYGLLDCRVGGGKKGRGGGSLWRPDLIAGWLVDRHAKGREGLPTDAARAALKRFPGCEEVVDDLFPSDK